MRRRHLASIESSTAIILITTLFVFLSGELWWRMDHSASMAQAIALALLITTLWWLVCYAYGAFLRSLTRRRNRARASFTPAFLANSQTALMGVALMAPALAQIAL